MIITIILLIVSIITYLSDWWLSLEKSARINIAIATATIVTIIIIAAVTILVFYLKFSAHPLAAMPLKQLANFFA